MFPLSRQHEAENKKKCYDPKLPAIEDAENHVVRHITNFPALSVLYLSKGLSCRHQKERYKADNEF